MMFAVLFALLGLFLAGFREGVWQKYTPEDVARWKSEASEAPDFVPVTHHPIAEPARRQQPAPVFAPAKPAPGTAKKVVVERELEAA
ncbi:MAG: hypothetical protein JWR44_2649 [Hymenobacter sp.]|nr:hypothetical protein [Hymenobacter sp.]